MNTFLTLNIQGLNTEYCIHSQICSERMSAFKFSRDRCPTGDRIQVVYEGESAQKCISRKRQLTIPRGPVRSPEARV